jgi:hypothetical protein
MSGEEDKPRFQVRRGRKHQIPFQERKIKSDSTSGQEDKISFHVRRRR